MGRLRSRGETIILETCSQLLIIENNFENDRHVIFQSCLHVTKKKKSTDFFQYKTYKISINQRKERIRQKTVNSAPT